MAADIALYPNLTGNVLTRSAMVSALDRNIGVVFDALKTTGTLANTVVVFTADNGAPFSDAFDMGDDPAMIQYMDPSKPRPPNPSMGPNGRCGTGGGSNYPMNGWKHYVFEGGVRSAAFIFGLPGAKAGSVHHGLFHAVDWLPTLAHLGGATTAKNLPLDGKDLSDFIRTGTGSPHDELPLQITACNAGYQSIVDGPQTAMLVGDMKLILGCYWRNSTDITHHKQAPRFQNGAKTILISMCFSPSTVRLARCWVKTTPRITAV